MNDHKEASRRLADERAWVAIRSERLPVPGQWKLLLNHRYAIDGVIEPQELYELQDDPLEQQNRLQDPAVRAVIDVLVRQAASAAGDNGQSRELPEPQ